MVHFLYSAGDIIDQKSQPEEFSSFRCVGVVGFVYFHARTDKKDCCSLRRKKASSVWPWLRSGDVGISFMKPSLPVSTVCPSPMLCHPMAAHAICGVPSGENGMVGD